MAADSNGMVVAVVILDKRKRFFCRIDGGLSNCSNVGTRSDKRYYFAPFPGARESPKSRVPMTLDSQLRNTILKRLAVPPMPNQSCVGSRIRTVDVCPVFSWPKS